MNELSLVILTSFPPQAWSARIRAEELFGESVLFVFFRAALCDLGTDAKVIRTVGPRPRGLLTYSGPIPIPRF